MKNVPFPSKIANFLDQCDKRLKRPTITLLISLFITIVIAICIKVNVGNFPKKELTCVLNSTFPLVTKMTNDSKLEILYNGEQVENPHFISITISNTGENVIDNSDFKEPFSIMIDENTKLLSSKIVEASHPTIINEIVKNGNTPEKNILTIGNFFLNPGENFTLGLITDNVVQNIKYVYRLSGIGSLNLRNTPKEKRESQLKARDNIMIFLIIIAIIVIVILVFTIKRNSRLNAEFDTKFAQALKDYFGEEHRDCRYNVDLENTLKDRIEATVVSSNKQ